MSAAYSLIQSEQAKKAKKAATLLAHCLDWSALRKRKGFKQSPVCILRGGHQPTMMIRLPPPLLSAFLPPPDQTHAPAPLSKPTLLQPQNVAEMEDFAFT